MPLPNPLRLPTAVLERTAALVGQTAALVRGGDSGGAVRFADVVEDVVEDVEELVEDGVELVADVVEEAQDLIEDALGLHRRVWEGDDGHVQIEVRGVCEPSAGAFRRRVQAALERVESVRWAEVNAITGRVAVAFDGRATPVGALLTVIEGVEDAHGMLRQRSAERVWEDGDRADHPSDIEPVHRAMVLLAGNSVALGAAVVGRLTRAPRIPVELAALTSMVDHLPWLRRGAEHLVGARAVDLVLPLLAASANGIAQGPTGILVDLAHQAAALTELQARRRVWERREPELFAEHSEEPIDPPHLDPRPVPIPAGPVEQASQRISMAAFGAAGLTLAATASARRAADALLAGTPKAARLGREGFATQLGRTLAARGVVPLDGASLRRLDRVDTVVLDSATLLSGRAEIDDVVPFGEHPVDDLRAWAEKLLDPEDPAAQRRRGRWALGPMTTGGDGPALPRGAKARAAELRRAGRTPLVLQAGDEVVALVALVDQLDPAAPILIRSVRRAGLRLVVAGRNGQLHKRIEHDAQIPSGRAMGAAVRDLQAGGAVVAVVARRGTTGLAAADVGINLARPSGRPSWGGDLLCGPDLTEAAFIVDAVAVAAAVSRRSAIFAAAGSTLGALASLTGRPSQAGRRAMTMVNGAAGTALASGTWAGMELARRPRVVLPDPTPWHELEPAEVLRLLESGPNGLSATQQRYRRRSARPEEVESTPVEPFLAELANPLNPLLAAGAGLSALAGSMVDAGMVAGLIGINTLVGGVQRLRTERALSSLLRTSANEVRILRDGREVVVAEDLLVRGDLVRLEAGEVVPADCRILEATNLEVDESNLTGESLPVPKGPGPCPSDEVADRSCMVYEDTTIAAGEATAVVVATGVQTETSRSVAAAAEHGDAPEGGVEVRLHQLTRQIVPFAAVAGAGAVVAGLVRRWPMRDVIGTGVSLAIASVPEGLPFIATAAQLASARRLSDRNAVVRNPRTIEALGRVDVLCFDKTGTLTEGLVRLQLVSDGASTESVDDMGVMGGEILAGAVRATAVDDDAGLDLTDRAILDAVAAARLPAEWHPEGWEPAGELPFEATRGLHAVLGRHATGHVISVKGSPEAILLECTRIRRGGGTVELDRAEVAALAEKVDELASSGYRVLAVAERQASGNTEVSTDRIRDLELLGLLAFSDPVRPTAASAVRGVRAAGVETVMITGDHPSTAEAIAANLGMLDPGAVPPSNGGPGRRLVLSGGELERLDDEELAAVVEQVAVFARVTPGQKVRVVQALQRAGRVVAMTGDGANDAPAIRLADVGVALGGRGTSAARDAADLVVTDDRLETIIDALAEGRALWGSVREAIAILVGGNLGEVGFTLVSSLFSRRAPMNPRQFLLVNLVTDLAPALAVAVRPPADTTPETLLREGPDSSLGGALDRDLAVRAVATAGGATAAWAVARLTGTPSRASTVGLVALVGTQLGQTAVAGRRSPLVLATAAGSAAVLAGVVQTPVLSQFFGCRPLGPVGWATATGSATAATVASVVGNRIVRVPD
jgi:cation-transporting P-type ATPase I